MEAVLANQDSPLIISDLNMSDMTGLQMIERLADKNVCLKVYKIILTTDFITQNENADFMDKKGKSIGIRAWFLKPLNEKNSKTFVEIIKDIIKGK